MKRVIVLLMVLAGTGCYSKSEVARIGAAGFFAGQIEARKDIQNFISGNGTLTGWEDSLMNIMLTAKNTVDDQRLILLTGKPFDYWRKKFNEVKK